MTHKISIENPATKTARNKTGKSDISNIMDDAPLFAGLDDYIQKQAVRFNADPAKESKKKKKEITSRVKQTETSHPVPQNIPKVQKKATSTKTDTMLLSVTEICALLKISRATLVRMDKSGQLPGRIKLGGSVRFHRETVETWLQSLITVHPIP